MAGAGGWNWQWQLNPPARRDIPDKQERAKLRDAADHGDPVRRQQQLVRGLRVLAAAAVWTRGREADERRPREVGGGRATAGDGPPHRASQQLPGGEEGHAGGRALEAGVRGGDHRAARDDGDGAAGRPHSRREEHSVGPGRRAGRDLQAARRAAAALQGREGDRREGRGHRLLPHRRAVQPHLVRAQVSAGREEGAQLRWLVDRVGQPGRGADREGSGMKTATERRKDGRTESGTLAEPTLWGLVGNTPLIPLRSFRPSDVPSLYLKAEWLNPGGSVKDRAALFILRDGIARGELPGKRLLDASSGNTAIAYAMLGAAAGIGVTVCVPRNASAERQALLDAYGAEVVLTDPLEGSDGAIREARRLAARRPDRFWYADQYNHPANPRAHYVTTAEELWRQTGGRITHLVVT